MGSVSGNRWFGWLSGFAVFLALASGVGRSVTQLATAQQPASVINAGGNDQSQQQGSKQARSSDEVQRLIENLGSDSYVTRVQAREKLQRMGLQAIDALRKAEDHLDYEIALSAKSIMGSYAIQWYESDDPQPVRDALEEYGAQKSAERLSRIMMLAELPDRMGLKALVRVTRFETSLTLSRRAAMEIMEQALAKLPEEREKNSALILEGLAATERPSADWLRVYSADLANGRYSVKQWRDVIRAQRDAIDALQSTEITRESVLNLVRICAVRALRTGDDAEALRLAMEHSDLVNATTTNLIEACNWAIDNGLHPFVEGLYTKNRPMFERSPILLYSHAHALKVGGNEDEAERLAEAAFQKNPFPDKDDEDKTLQPRELEEKSNLHREIAGKLRERGLFQWAEREYTNIIESMPFDDLNSLVARIELSQMHVDLNRHQALVDLLSPVVDRMNKDAQFRTKLMMHPGLGRFSQRWKSQIDYHSALIALEKEVDDADESEVVREKARKGMMDAFLANQQDIDVLIRMFRTKGDDQWRADVKRLLAKTSRTFEIEVANREAMYKQMRTPEAGEGLAEALNNYAWLICNTEGDFGKALKNSLRSLEFVEDSAKLDTCGRCYFALGDFDNAIRVQKRALELDPYSPPLKRQLAEFESAKAKSDEVPVKDE